MNVVGLVDQPYSNSLSAIFGGIIVVSTEILQFQKYHEMWLVYKNTKAKLLNEFYCYKYKIGEMYNKDNRDGKFVGRCESILLSEAIDFLGLFNSVNPRPSAQTNESNR